MSIKAMLPENIGLIVEVVELHETGAWVTKTSEPTPDISGRMTHFGLFEDGWLMPTRPQPDEETETSDELETA